MMFGILIIIIIIIIIIIRIILIKYTYDYTSFKNVDSYYSSHFDYLLIC